MLLKRLCKIAPPGKNKRWIGKIEDLRNDLNASQAEVSIMDYGAVSPELNLTDQMMDQGRVVTRNVGELSRNASKPYVWDLLLFKLVREFKPSRCLELGTCLGLSASYQAAALKLNQGGRIVTLEGAESLASLARQHFRALGLDNVDMAVGRFKDTLGGLLDKRTPIDYAFIDGHHDEQATLSILIRSARFYRKEQYLFLMTFHGPRGMKRAWSTIQADPRIKVAVDLTNVGICLVDIDLDRKHIFKMQLNLINQQSPTYRKAVPED